MMKEKQTILNTKEILYDVDIIKDIVFTKDKIILSSYIEEIILEYFLKELFNPILFKYENTFKKMEKNILDQKVKIFITNYTEKIYYDFFEKFIKVNIIKLTNEYSEYKIFEGKDEIITLLFFNIYNVSSNGELSKEDRNKLKKFVKSMNDFLEKKIVKYF